VKINFQQLQAQLKQSLSQAYLLCGDEILLIQEARDQILQHALTAGYTERQTYHATSDFNWDSLLAEITLQSLFSSKTLIELRINNGKPGKAGCAAIETFLNNPPRDKILVIMTPKLDASQQKTKWVKAIEQQGTLVTVWPIEATQLPQWIKDRLQQEELSTTPEGLRLLAEQTQGNLLACAQEITKLRLLYGAKKLSTEEINSAIGDHARFDIFKFVDQALLGQAEPTLRILSQLYESGAETTLILWSFTREIRQLLQLATLMARGERFDSACSKIFVWKTRQHLYQNALRRLSQPQLLGLLQLAARIDLMIKGLQPGNPWLAINELALGMAGTRLPTRESVC
jgi:DNA polymerase-3 subunit delta